MSQEISGLKFIENEADKLALLDFKSKISEDPFQAIASWNNSHSWLQLYRYNMPFLQRKSRDSWLETKKSQWLHTAFHREPYIPHEH